MMMMRKKIVVSILFLLAALLAGVNRPAAAQDPAPKPTPSDNEVNRVAKQMFCPVCENIPLDVCPTQACTEWRELIRLKLSQGWSDDQIKQYFATQYGDRVLNEPPRRGLNWLVYTLPGLFFLLGLLVLWRVLGGRKAKPAMPVTQAQPPASPAPTAAEEDPYLKAIEDELKKST
jgi:cytochrome c-type biogenesis protein CcmH